MPKFNLNVPVTTTTPTVVVEDLPSGQHRFQLVVEDEAGNRSAPDTRPVTVLPAVPVITDFNPRFGAWGDPVVLTGRHFDPNPGENHVSFNGVAATIEAATTEQLTVRVPQPASTGPIAVQTSQGAATGRQPFIIPRFSTFSLDAEPGDLDVDELKQELWIAAAVNNQAGFVLVFNLGAMKVTDRIRLESLPHRLAVSPARASRVCLVSSQPARTATIIELGARRMLATIPLNSTPHGLAISPDGQWGYVVCEGSANQRAAQVHVIDLAARRLLTQISVALGATEVVFGPNGREAFVNNPKQGLVTVIDVATHKVSDKVVIPGTESVPAVAVTGETYPCWTANGVGKAAGVINAAHVVTAVELPLAPATLAVNKAGTRAFLANADDDAMVMVTTKNLRSFNLAGVPLPAPALADKSLILTPDEAGLCVLHPRANSVSLYRAEDAELQAVVPVRANPTRGLCTADGQSICFLNQAKQSLTVLERPSVLP